MTIRHEKRWSLPVCMIAAPLLIAVCWTTTASAVNWDGGGDGSDWQDPLNWAGDVVPSGANTIANLGNVDTGVRAVTVTGTPTAVKLLTMVQTAAAATNVLTITGRVTMNTVDSNDLFFNQTLGGGLPKSALELNLESTGEIRFSYSPGSGKSQFYFVNRGVWNLNGGLLHFDNNRFVRKYIQNH